MKLTDIGKVTSTKLNEALQENAGWSIKLDKLTVRSARNMMESIDQKLSAVKKSTRAHTSERDPNYVNMLMAKNVLETFVRESKKPDFLDVDKDGDTKEPMKQALKQKKSGSSKVDEEKLSYDEFTGKGKESWTVTYSYSAGKGGKRTRDMTMVGFPIGSKESDVEKSFNNKHPNKKFISAKKNKDLSEESKKEGYQLWPNQKKKSFYQAPKDKDGKTDIQKWAEKKKAEKSKIDEAKKAKEPGAVATAQVMKMGGSYVTKDGKHLTKKGIEKRDEIIKAIEKDKKQVKESATFSARRRLLEDELSQAQSMLAAKDMVDSIQDMIEELSRMQNEQLPPLADSIRASFGASEADTFKNSATSSLQSLLTNLQSARDGMDQAVRVLAGEPAEMPGAGSELDIGEPSGDEFSATEPAKGGELPMGREKRV